MTLIQPDISIITTVKNRLEHFKKVFPSLVTQNQNQNYEIIFVDYDSNDNFKEELEKHIECYKPLFSDKLKLIKRVYLNFEAPFNSGKAKNLGSVFSSSKWLSFTDIDVFLSMNYHRHWLDVLNSSENIFFSSRVQETTERKSSRVSPRINYGNMIVKKDHFLEIGGFEEENLSWGGDDDDIIHRLKLLGLREINPHTYLDAEHITILHGDEERLTYLESKEKSKENTEKKFNKIYENKDFLCKSYLKFYNSKKESINVEEIFTSS